MRILKKISTMLVVAAMFGLVTQTAQASMVTTDTVVASQQSQVSRDQLVSTLQRSDIQQQLVSMGVSSIDAIERVSSLTDVEIVQLNAKLADMPAGAGAGGTIVLIALILVITELTGVTDIF